MFQSISVHILLPLPLPVAPLLTSLLVFSLFASLSSVFRKTDSRIPYSLLTYGGQLFTSHPMGRGKQCGKFHRVCNGYTNEEKYNLCKYRKRWKTCMAEFCHLSRGSNIVEFNGNNGSNTQCTTPLTLPAAARPASMSCHGLKLIHSKCTSK